MFRIVTIALRGENDACSLGIGDTTVSLRIGDGVAVKSDVGE
jgi:hypothetical protein